MFSKRNYLGSDYGEPIHYDPVTGEPLINDSYVTDTGAPVPIVSQYPHSYLTRADLESYFNHWVWPALQRCATESEIDDVMIGAYDEIGKVFPFGSQTTEQAQMVSEMIDQYTQRAYAFLNTGSDPWGATTALTGKSGTVVKAGIVAAAVVGIHRLIAGDWIWNAFRGMRW